MASSIFGSEIATRRQRPGMAMWLATDQGRIVAQRLERFDLGDEGRRAMDRGECRVDRPADEVDAARREQRLVDEIADRAGLARQGRRGGGVRDDEEELLVDQMVEPDAAHRPGAVHHRHVEAAIHDELAEGDGEALDDMQNDVGIFLADRLEQGQRDRRSGRIGRDADRDDADSEAAPRLTSLSHFSNCLSSDWACR